MPKQFVEYGFDLDQHPLGFGVSTEIEYPDGHETRQKGRQPFKKIDELYLRFWLGYHVFVVSTKGCRHTKKKRRNFKILFGLSGEKDFRPKSDFF
ncbi:DUF3977 family protein [Enterococcus nangangensis]|uniref:DUF3977 family protein n=1 Tax=Enterococcus nangangensis TaxID=2559926 RepID=UPI0010F8DA2C|nr:DUF3977 family protein [Enterococcus nangangensis]